ncbi:MAG: PaaI family thioesterase [Actinomycetota bacterium]|nr:PaaI family thioesterase [Actinomycetota bacterium]
MALPDPSSFTELTPELQALWQRYAKSDRPQFMSHVGLSVDEVRLDYCHLSLPFHAALLNAGGAIHGGVVATLIDTACVPAVGSGFTKARPYSTIDLHIQYMGAAAEDDLEAAAWVTKRGRSIVFCDAEVATTAGKTLARGSLTFKVS